MRGTEVKVCKGLGQGVLPADTPHIKLGPCPEGCALEVSQTGFSYSLGATVSTTQF